MSGTVSPRTLDARARLASRPMLAWRRLSALAAASALAYVALAYLSREFAGDPTHRPIPAVLTIFGVVFIFYLAAQRAALECPPRRTTVSLIVGAAVAFRLVLLFSHPILERDYYRYLWDGAVSVAGVSPYRYSPREILDAPQSHHDPVAARLGQLAAGSPPLQEILGNVHFTELRTIYPPVSQVVFSATAALTPMSASLADRVRILKLALLLFDVGTIFVILRLLHLAGRHPGWLISYAWCPLVLNPA